MQNYYEAPSVEVNNISDILISLNNVILIEKW